MALKTFDKLEIYVVFCLNDILVPQKIYAIVYDCSFIAGLHNSAKVWVAHTEYTISKKSRGPHALQ